MFESALTERRRPLPLNLSDFSAAVESVLCTRLNRVRHFHCLAGNSAIILSTLETRWMQSQIKSNQIKFICDTKIQMPMKEVKRKVMCQQDTKAVESCTNRCPNRKKI